MLFRCISQRNSHISSLNRIALQTFSDKLSDIKFENCFDKFKLILDVRSSNEYLQDHVSRAVNIPILNNNERDTVGKIYDKSNPLSARLLGSSLIMNNLSNYLKTGGILHESLKENIINDDDKILVYCWRGGQRSQSVALVLSEIYFNKQPICVLDGGYKAYRRYIIENLETLLNYVTFIGICGYTGSGKTKILNALKSNGEMVLDLENLADHKGSIFGYNLNNYESDEAIGFSQLSQKYFESKLFEELLSILKNSNNARKSKDNKLIIWVECESWKIGNIHLSSTIWNLIENCKRIIIETSKEERIQHIISEYNYWTNDSNSKITLEMIQWLSKHCSKSLIKYWTDLIVDHKFSELVDSLLVEHYDPLYKKNRQKYMDCEDERMVMKLKIDSLDCQFINNYICPKLISISKDLFT